MVLKSTPEGGNGNGNGGSTSPRNDALLRALTYQAGEHPLTTPLPAAPDDGFLDSRSTRHKRLPHLLRDLEYVFETPGTALRLLLTPQQQPSATVPLPGVDAFNPDHILAFPSVWSRLLRLAQGMDPQKRKISGGHVEYEQNRWLEAFGLSLNFAGTRDALAESPSSSLSPLSGSGPELGSARAAVGNLLAALLREIKLWLYREGLLETLPVPSPGALGEMGQLEALQRSTLHVSSSQIGAASASGSVTAVALSCATGVKMTEAQLVLIENALRMEQAHHSAATTGGVKVTRGAIMGDWLRVPHSPLAGECLSFHLPLHRAFARSLRSTCSVIVPESDRAENPMGWWKLPILDEEPPATALPPSVMVGLDPGAAAAVQTHPLAAVLRNTLRSSNCRVVWSSGPECSAPEAQLRRQRLRAVSAAIASAKVIHSLCDHPLRCLAASQQIERHLWARNGSSAAGMALNYGSAPLCRSFRDLDLTLVQFSASGLSVGLGARRVFALLTSRFSMDGYLCDPERRGGSPSPTSSGGYGGAGWVNPPRLQDPDHAIALSESFFATLCLLVTELPSPPPTSTSDDTALRRNVRRELLHALAAEPRSHSEAMAAASAAVVRRDEAEGGGGGSSRDGSGGTSFRSVFADVLRDVGRQKNLGGSRAATGAPSFELRAECSNEYDPTFFHLRRHEHQHAMDNVARLRKQKVTSSAASPTNAGKDTTGGKNSMCFPLVCPPPLSHPRFMPCRLLLHLPPMDAAVRRSLLLALTGGQWLPPPEPEPLHSSEKDEDGTEPQLSQDEVMQFRGISRSRSGSPPTITGPSFRELRRSSSRARSKSNGGSNGGGIAPNPPFSPSVVATSSISFLEVLQILTLQVHTLEGCASLHRNQELDEESRSLSSGLSINSYLGRLVHVPSSLKDVWALRSPGDGGPLPSKGSGEHRGSILGLLVALYEHRSDHGGGKQGGSSGSNEGGGDDGHGGARTLTADGLKWLLRFVNALVDGASSVSAACQSATLGIPIRRNPSSSSPSSSAGMSSSPMMDLDLDGGASWTIDRSVRDAIASMLLELPDLWPKLKQVESPTSSSGGSGGLSAKAREARKAAQMRALERMKKQQASFAEFAAKEGGGSSNALAEKEADDEEADLCIICRCDDADGENNGPLGYLGHVQRSRALQLRSLNEMSIGGGENGDNRSNLHSAYRVVGDRGCQLRATEAMDSAQVECLPMGSVVTVLQSRVSPKYDILSRRVLVRHVRPDLSDPKKTKVTEGWASVQSSQGYVILSPLSNLCYSNSRWGCTRPIVRQCGHAAHLRCVETHCLSLHQRAAGEQPYDGRFAANIDDGEFLCPLCKQLSNVLVPTDEFCRRKNVETSRSPNSGEASTLTPSSDEIDPSSPMGLNILRHFFQSSLSSSSNSKDSPQNKEDDKQAKATRQFGENLFQAMQIPWSKNDASAKRRQKRWHPALRRWDFEEDGEELYPDGSSSTKIKIGSILRLLRQQHIAWAAVGHSAAGAEASGRNPGVGMTEDPWSDYGAHSRDNHPSLLELKRTMIATSGLQELLTFELGRRLGEENGAEKDPVVLIGSLLVNILEGSFWSSSNLGEEETSSVEEWRVLTALLVAMPCHVARDGMLSQRHEARACAAAMWAVRGKASKLSSNDDKKEPSSDKAEETSDTPPRAMSEVEDRLLIARNLSDQGNERLLRSTSPEPPLRTPPAPLAVRNVCASSTNEGEAGLPCLTSQWGTMDPFEAAKGNVAQTALPFRPGVASSFLYMPLLAWDLNTLGGAMFSSILSSQGAGVDVPSLRYVDLLLLARVLLLGRLIQTMVTPDGFDLSSFSSETSFFEEGWTDEEIMKEGTALWELLSHCRTFSEINIPAGKENIKRGGGNIQKPSNIEEATKLINIASHSVLPFARSLVLLLRACSSALRQRRRFQKSKRSTQKPTPADKVFESLVEDGEVMEWEDGFRVWKLMGGPLPSQVLNGSSLKESSSPSWMSLIDRWLKAIRCLEVYHGSRGDHLVFDKQSETWIPQTSSGSRKMRKQTENIDSKSTSGSTIVLKDSKGRCISDSPAQDAGDMAVEAEVAPAVSIRADENGGQGFVGTNISIDMTEVDPNRNEVIVEENDDGEFSFAEFDGEVEEEEMLDEDDDHALSGLNMHVVDAMVDDEESDDSEEDVEMETAEEAVEATLGGGGIDLTGGPIAGLARARSMETDGNGNEDSDDDSSCHSNGKTSASSALPLDRDFAYSSRSSIIPYQPTILGMAGVGPGPRGAPFEYGAARGVVRDLSHLGMVHRMDPQRSALIRLPRSFVELYGMVNRVKGRTEGGAGHGAGGTSLDENYDDGSGSETAICLLTGSVMKSGSSRRAYTRSTRPPGACTLHARSVGSGIGIFFLVQKCTVLLVHNNKSAYSASLYVDEHGEEDPGLRRGRPLFLKDDRYEALEALWRRHGIPREVAQIRSTSDRVIRDNWY